MLVLDLNRSVSSPLKPAATQKKCIIIDDDDRDGVLVIRFRTEHRSARTMFVAENRNRMREEGRVRKREK